jgi:hypothetical protein
VRCERNASSDNATIVEIFHQSCASAVYLTKSAFNIPADYLSKAKDSGSILFQAVFRLNCTWHLSKSEERICHSGEKCRGKKCRKHLTRESCRQGNRSALPSILWNSIRKECKRKARNAHFTSFAQAVSLLSISSHTQRRQTGRETTTP